MKILLTGAAGQLGQELHPRLARRGAVTAVDRQTVTGLEGRVLDLSDLNQVEIFLNRLRPDVIVNAAAYTAVDQAESDSQTAFRVNADLPGCLARWTRRREAFLLHYSTDYVFGGESARPYREDDLTGPNNVYGDSKLAGEWAIKASECRHIILRTSWVYSTHGNNFVLSMLRLAGERTDLNVVCDQTGCPTWARNLADASKRLLDRVLCLDSVEPEYGIYHYCDAGVTTWFDFAQSIFALAKKLGLLRAAPAMTPVKTETFPQAAQRPMYSVLDTSAIRSAFGIEPAGLQDSLEACLKELV
jgi:dTDP-4-dehydrorhamnose reductase